MKKLIVSLMVAVVILLGCNVFLSLELVDTLKVNERLSGVIARSYDFTNTNVEGYWIGYGGIHKVNR